MTLSTPGRWVSPSPETQSVPGCEARPGTDLRCSQANERTRRTLATGEDDNAPRGAATWMTTSRPSARERRHRNACQRANRSLIVPTHGRLLRVIGLRDLGTAASEADPLRVALSTKRRFRHSYWAAGEGGAMGKTPQDTGQSGGDWEVVTGDSLTVMRGMTAGSVDAIVTSPPYADQRAYEPGELGGRRGNHPANQRQRARSRAARSNAPAEWVEWIEPYTAEMLRVLSPAGSAMLNLGVVLRDGEEHDCTDAILRGCRAQGWKLLHRLIWHKTNGQVPSAPGYLTVSHEFVLWLAPTTAPWRAFTQPVGSQASREVRTPHAPSSVARMAGLYTGAGAHRKQGKTHKLHPDGARPTTVFVAAVGGEPNPSAHPGRMAPKLAQHLVAMTCPPGGLVLDPFSGDATTGVMARRIGRRYLGIEVNAEYAEASRRRLADDAPLFAPVTVAAEPLAL